MKKEVVTFEQLVDLAIGTPESAVNFAILHKVLKLMTRHCCKSDYTFELDMDNMKAEVTTIAGKRSKSSSSIHRKSHVSSVSSGQSETSDEYVQTEVKMEKDVVGSENEYEENVRIKIENDSRQHSTEQKVHESSTDKPKQSEGGSEKHKQSEGRKDSEKDHNVKDTKETKRKKVSEGHRKKDESKRKSTEKHSKVQSEENVKKKDSKKRMEALEDFNKQSENRTNELENQLKELTERMESITQIIATHLSAEHLALINEEIDKLKKNAEDTSDQCFEVTNTINDQSSQIQGIVATINNIQLRKVENEELIDLLSGKADHSFVDEKVSISQFEEILQGLRDVINESTLQLDAVRLETNASLDDIKADLLTKLLAEEFDEAKTKIYKELIKLTEQHELILAQQNEHVAAGAKMRNLNCFVCNSDVVMLLEQETIPKFRPLKASLQPLEPIVGSKIMIGKDAPEWKNHQLKARDFTRTSKSSRFNADVGYGKSTYVKGKNGCMYKGNVGCDCVEGMNANGKGGRSNCCGNTVEAMNMKNISLTNRMNSESRHNGVGDVPNESNEIDNKKIEKDVQPAAETINDLKERTTVEALNVAQTTTSTTVPDVIEIKKEIDETIDNAALSVPTETTEIHENINATGSIVEIDGNLTIKTENEDVPNETNSVSQDIVVKVENQ